MALSSGWESATGDRTADREYPRTNGPSVEPYRARTSGSRLSGAVVEIRVRHELQTVALEKSQEVAAPVRTVELGQEFMADPAVVAFPDEPKFIRQKTRVIVFCGRQGCRDRDRDLLGLLGPGSKARLVRGLGEQELPNQSTHVPARARVVIQVEQPAGTKALRDELQQRIADVLRNPRKDAVRQNVVELAGQSTVGGLEIRVMNSRLERPRADFQTFASSIWLAAPSSPDEGGLSPIGRQPHARSPRCRSPRSSTR